MAWLTEALRTNVELAMFLTIMVGYALAAVRIGSFSLNPILATLVAGLAIGQLGIQVPGPMQRMFFLLFLFGIGFRTGPEFFRGLRATAVPQVGLTILLVGLGFIGTLTSARLLQLDPGSTAGLFAGTLTNSTALGAATNAAAKVSSDPVVVEQIAGNTAAVYALTYVLGAVLVVWCLPTLGPRLMRVNLREVSRELERTMALNPHGAGPNSLYREFSVRAYRVPAVLDGHSAAEVERLWPADQRVIVSRVRRADAIIDVATPDMRLQADDVVAVAARTTTLATAPAVLSTEVNDRELLNIPMVAAELVVTSKRLAGLSLEDFVREVAARNAFLLRIRRAGRDLPFTRSTTVERSDVLSVIGTAPEISRIAETVGYVEYPTQATDLLLVAGAVVAGALIGLPSFVVGGLVLSLTVPVGVLLSALTLGHLRGTHPRFGRIPDAAVALFGNFGLTAFLAIVGLNAAPAAVNAVREAGIPLLVASAIMVLLPHIVTILVGYHLVGMHPAVLLGLCAGAGTSGPALAAVEATAESKMPSLGYGVPCAVGNLLMAIGATLIVIAS